MDSCNALCEVCGELFTLKKNLYAHLRRQHNVEAVISDKEMCNVCDKRFLSVAALDRHRKTHETGTGKVLCTECDFACKSNAELRRHLGYQHGVNVEERELEFDTMEHFLQWKARMESDENACFVNSHGKKMGKNKETRLYYDCHRSGTAVKRGSGQRLRGLSNKIGRTCPASLVVKQTLGKVSVKFYMTHTGHGFSVGYLHLTPDNRAMVAGLIKDGVPDNKILERVRESVIEGHFKRLHLLERKDIYNIRREHKLEYSCAHENDALSVHFWVQQQFLLGEESSVVFYKQQGAEHEVLSKDDFMLVIMTPFQLDMAVKFLPLKVLMDTTHGTNRYHFHLTTLMTVDNYAVGCPVAYCLSTRMDKTSMTVFLSAVKEKIGVVKTKVFMSDDCSSYYNAWNTVMGPSEHRLLCTWHVEQAWTRNLSSKIKDKIVMCDVYKVLKIVQLQTDEAKFNEMLDGFVRWCSEDPQTRDFGLYFANEYVKRPEMWAYCYRVGLGLNTNMYLEALHKTLKYCYLSEKVNYRVDRCVQALLHQTRDMMFERAIRLCKGGITSGRISKITKSHKKSAEIEKEMISSAEDGTWQVNSLTKKLPYTVATAESSCPSDCPLACPECKVCVHKYICTCVDHLIRGNLCKHIHAIVRHQGSREVIAQDRQNTERDLQTVVERAALQTSAVASIVDVQAALCDRFAVLQGMVTPENATSVLASFDKLIQEVGKMGYSQRDNSQLQEVSIPHFPATLPAVSANKKCKKQMFYSIKKGTAKRPRMSSSSEVLAVEQGLLNGTNISTGHDHTYDITNAS